MRCSGRALIAWTGLCQLESLLNTVHTQRATVTSFWVSPWLSYQISLMFPKAQFLWLWGWAHRGFESTVYILAYPKCCLVTSLTTQTLSLTVTSLKEFPLPVNISQAYPVDPDKSLEFEFPKRSGWHLVSFLLTNVPIFLEKIVSTLLLSSVYQDQRSF